jgi:hypothetical protein
LLPQLKHNNLSWKTKVIKREKHTKESKFYSRTNMQFIHLEMERKRLKNDGLLNKGDKVKYSFINHQKKSQKSHQAMQPQYTDV